MAKIAAPLNHLSSTSFLERANFPYGMSYTLAIQVNWPFMNVVCIAIEN